MKRTVLQKLYAEKLKAERRLDRAVGGMEPREGEPEYTTERVRYEMADRTRAISAGGIGVMHQMVNSIGLRQSIDDGLTLLKYHRPYLESEHVLNITYNVLCGGKTLDDIELRRNDLTYLDALGARAIPDPTTAGDFCRRFKKDDIWKLMEAINNVRVGVWNRRGSALTGEVARIDADGSVVPTDAECKQGIDYNHYKRTWGYHPLLVSLANTNEVLYIVNRSGNRPSHEGAPDVFDKAVALCREGGFKDILLRGDTDFSLTRNFDRWDADGVRFVFGYDASQPLKSKAGAVPEAEYEQLIRDAGVAFGGKERTKAPRVKERIVVERGYRNIILESEDIAEFEHKPSKAKKTYRIVVLRKNLIEECRQQFVCDSVRYFFYVTNDSTMTKEEVVAEANQRCNQENLIAQLKGGVRALHSPLNTLEANWAYMVMAALAWNLKAWFALLLPTSSRWADKHEAERQEVLRMEFHTFLANFMLVPAQVVRSGRRLIFRLLAWRPRLHIMIRLLNAI
jgi:hypothetical protein